MAGIKKPVIANLMFSKRLGGMEQSFANYCFALLERNYKSYGVIAPEAAIKCTLDEKQISLILLSNLGQWDFWASFKFKKILEKNEVTMVIAHGKRAITLAKRSAANIPIIAVIHDAKDLSCAKGCTAMITVNQNLLKSELSKNPSMPIIEIPNMLNGTPPVFKWEAPKKIPVIGALGRFSPEKGFFDFIMALGSLKKKGFKFKAILGGDGPLRKALEYKAKLYDLEEELAFIGWVGDKEKFYREIDLFCLPSLKEHFGIVILEAFFYGKPIIATKTQGPVEILSQLESAFLVEPNNPKYFAFAIEKILSDPKLCERMAYEGYNMVKHFYCSSVVGDQLEQFLQKVSAA